MPAKQKPHKRGPKKPALNYATEDSERKKQKTIEKDAIQDQSSQGLCMQCFFSTIILICNGSYEESNEFNFKIKW